LSAAAALVPPEPAPAIVDASPVGAVMTPIPSAPTAPAPTPVAFDPHALVDPDLWPLLPDDLPELLALVPQADLYVQDEVDIRHLPTLTRLWSRKGHAGQRKVRAPGYNQKSVGFAAVDWRDGWCAWALAPRRTADVFVEQLAFLVKRSQERGRIALVLLDNLKIHTPAGAKKVREALETHGDKLRLIYTPAYDPDANPIERLWPPFRRAVTHNHQRDNVVDLYRDAFAYFEEEDKHPDRVLRHIGSPFAIDTEALRLTA
jgi:DDE superfamily endonuclease